MKLDKPNCYDCKHRGDISGSAHSSCEHPGNQRVKANPLLELASMLAGGHMPPVKCDTSPKVKGHPHGIRNGWFGWPFNFDPGWLLECDSFEAKDE